MVAKVYKCRYNYSYKITNTKIHSSSLPVEFLDVGLTLQGAISRFIDIQGNTVKIQYNAIQYNTQGAHD